MYCPEIQIFPDSITLFQDGDGRIILDIDGGTTLTLAKALNISDEISLVKQPLDINLVVPNTPKNYFYLKTLFDPNTDKTNGHFVTVRISSGSTTYLNNRLYGIKKNNKSIEVLLSYRSEWITLLKNTKLKDIDLPSVSFTKEDVDDKWLNNKIYLDGDPGYWYPVVYYGAWRVPNRRLVVEDLRPFLHATFLLQKMFDYIGYCFESPFYETNFGRSLICYLLKNDYSNDERLRLLWRFNATKLFAANEQHELKITDWTENDDDGNNFDNVNGHYQRGFEGKFIITIQTGTSTNDIIGNVPVYLAVVKQILLGGQTYEFAYRELLFLNEKSFYQIDVPINVLADEYVWFSYSTDQADELTPSFTVKISVSNEIERSMYSKGDTIDLKKEVDQSVSCYEVLLGLRHLINGIFDEDVNSKKIILHTPYSADIYGESIPGYFDNTFNDLKSLQPKDSANSLIEDSNSARFFNLGFKKSTDPTFNRKKRDDGSDQFSKQIDLGDYFTSETKDELNPLFEGTALERSQLFGTLTNIVFDPYPYRAYFPALTDNIESKVSYNIGARILYAVGFGQHSININLYNWETEYINDLAFAYQAAGLVNPLLLKFDNAIIEEKLTYGDEEGDLWSMVYGKFFMQLHGKIKIDFLLHMNDNLFQSFDLKNIFEIEYDGHPVSGRVLSINDYQPCKELTAQLFLLPEITAGNICLDSTTPQPCNNLPTIVTTINGSCITFGIGGTFDCVITSISWEIKSETTGGLWDDLGSGDTIQVCDYGEQYMIRATIQYDCVECPTSVIVISIDPCFNTYQCVLTQYIDESGQICIQYELIGAAQGECTIDVMVTGGIHVDHALDAPYLLCGLLENTEYNFYTNFACDNGCIIPTLICTINTGNGEQCNNNPVLVCVPIDVNGIICYEFILEGQSSDPYETFIVTWECDSGEMGTWLPGDDPVCCSGVITAHAIVFYCGCPEVCTETITCDPNNNCSGVNPGTAIMLAVCN